MLALGSAWLGLFVCLLSAVMVVYRPAFHDLTLPVVLYGAVIAIGCGGLVLMRKTQPGDRAAAVDAQRLQAQVGIGLGMVAVIVTYGLMALARPVASGG